MRYLALACDYDGTLAFQGRVADETIYALERLVASGRKLILVSGRELDDLLSVFPRVDLFEQVVAENGALLYSPAKKVEKVLASRPTDAFVDALRWRNVSPLSVGRVIVSTWHPNELAVLEVIRDLGLELQVVFNKGAVMIQPSGINKATGLVAALNELKLSPHNVVGIGDAENDHAFLTVCEAAVAVANALPMVQELADMVTQGDHGEGVKELIGQLLTDDLRGIDDRLSRHNIPLGKLENGDQMAIKPYGENVLLAGSSGSGKSTLVTGFLERLAERVYQFCVVDPEGDYEDFEQAVTLGSSQRAPSVAEVLQLLDNPAQNAVVNLLGDRLEDRPIFFATLLPILQELRVRTGRPHWLVVDEAHHLLPTPWDPALLALPQELEGLMLVTVHPGKVSPAILSSVHMVVVVGDTPAETLEAFSEATRRKLPQITGQSLELGEAMVWSSPWDRAPLKVRVIPSEIDRRRHRRKYAEGDLGSDKSFYFRGPLDKLNLRAQNLVLFNQIADGVDDATWMHHLRLGDYSRWFRDAIKDEELAAKAKTIETLPDISPAESRTLIRKAIEERYTLSEKPAPTLIDVESQSDEDEHPGI